MEIIEIQFGGFHLDQRLLSKRCAKTRIRSTGVTSKVIWNRDRTDGLTDNQTEVESSILSGGKDTNKNKFVGART